MSFQSHSPTTCLHGVPMSASCTLCGRWVHQSVPAHPAVGEAGPTYALADRREELSLAYLDLIADCLIVMAERAAPDGGRRRAEYERLHVESAPHRGGAQ